MLSNTVLLLVVSIKVSDLEAILSIPIANIILFHFYLLPREVLDQNILVNEAHPVFKQHPEFQPWESSGILTQPLDTVVCRWHLETRNTYIFLCFQTLGPLHNFYFRYGERELCLRIFPGKISQQA